MSTKKSVSKVVSVDEQAYEQEVGRAEHEDVVDETPEFRATVEMEIQAKVDANHPDGMVDTSEDRIYGVTLAQEERIRAREEELERISAQAAFGRQEGRAERTRAVVEQMYREQRPVKEVDPREELERRTGPGQSAGTAVESGRQRWIHASGHRKTDRQSGSRGRGYVRGGDGYERRNAPQGRDDRADWNPRGN